MANGNREPVRVIEGQETRMGRSIHGIAYDAVHDEIIASSPMASAILVFRGAANGNEAPIRVIQGPKTKLVYPHAVSFDEQNNEIIVADLADPYGMSISVFARDAQGDVPPLRVISGPNTKLRRVVGVAVDPERNLLLASSRTPGREGILVFNRTDNGDVTPQAMIAGPHTEIFNSPRQLQVYQGKIFLAVTNSYNPPSRFISGREIANQNIEILSPWRTTRLGFIGVWDVNDNGDVPPRAIIRGPQSGLIHPGGVALNPKNGEVIAVDSVNNGIFTFSVPEFLRSQR
jgi:hypothetical protein